MLDTTDSVLPLQQVVAIVKRLCDEFTEDEIASIMVINQPEPFGPVTIEMVGKEVPQWLL